MDLPSECVVLYASQDVQTQRFLIDQALDRERIPGELEKLQGMVDYCHTENCLQQFIVTYFGEPDAKDVVDVRTVRIQGKFKTLQKKYRWYYHVLFEWGRSLEKRLQHKF